MTTIMMGLSVEHTKRNLYVVDEETIARIDYKRKCFICREPLEIGDEMTLLSTNRGNKLVQTRCWDELLEAQGA